jgi:hypothetical protein
VRESGEGRRGDERCVVSVSRFGSVCLSVVCVCLVFHGLVGVSACLLACWLLDQPATHDVKRVVADDVVACDSLDKFPFRPIQK